MLVRRSCAVLLSGLLGVGGVASGQVLSQPMPAPTHSVFPMSGGNERSVFHPGIDAMAERPAHPPLDQIPPLPMPSPDEGISDPTASWSVTAHDAVSGRTWELPETRDGVGGGFGQSAGDFPGVDNNYVAEPMTRNFGSMYPAGSLDSWPRSGNVKLVMEFIDQNGVPRWFTASGSMQDAGVVLTAAHCVYSRAPSGINIFNWANRIYIYPAWDGDSSIPQFAAPTDDDVVQYFGYARGDYFLAGSDYVNNGNFDRDCAVIRINRGSSRSVGMLTGWFGWAYGGDCSWIQDHTYSNFSYPAENCGGGLHTGRTMYYWSGTWDSCPGNQLQLNTGGGCLDTVWGGMSGSGAYYIDGDNRYVHAVCSNSNRNDMGRYCKLWDQFVTDMEDFKAGTRGATFDVELMRCRAGGSTTVQAGTSFASSFLVLGVNATNYNPGTRTYTIRIYLSSNNNISATDTLLATWNYNYDFGAMGTVNFSVPTPYIPITTPPGTYWIGAILDDGTDVFADNNDTDTWDAQQVTVTLGLPDPPTAVSPLNGATNVDVNADLDWSSAARASYYHVYFGTDPTNLGFMGDQYVSSLALSELNPNTQYFWQVISHNDAGHGPGPVWSFTTGSACDVDLNSDGQLDFFDLQVFLNLYSAHDSRADMNHDGSWDFFDVQSFLTAFSSGC